jgi:hypothetical protein
MSEQVPELKKELMFNNYYLYECNHIATGEYGTQGVLPVGRYANILVCKHCWQNLRDMFLADAFRDLLSMRSGPELTAMMKELLAQRPDIPRIEYGDPRWGTPGEDEE